LMLNAVRVRRNCRIIDKKPTGDSPVGLFVQRKRQVT